MQNGLTGLDILLDSHDLAMTEGTGIKTYGRHLISVLKELGANPDLFISARTSSHTLIGRTLLYDAPERKEKELRGWHRVVKQTMKFRFHKAAHIPAACGGKGPKVPDSIFPHGLGCSVMYNCYRAARTIQEKRKVISTFQTRKNYAVWHATQPLPLRHKNAVQITTVHDLIPLLQPHLCDELRHLFYQRVKESISRSRVIAADSECTKADLLDHFSVPEEKIVVTHLFSDMSGEACDPDTMAGVMNACNLKRDQYILFVGSLDPRKNVRRLVEAYLSLKSDQTLVLVGKMGWRGDEELKILAHFKKKRGQDVRLLSYVPLAALPALYQGASCLAFPSLAEGFGLPPLEAMISGCPVVCSTATSLPEVGGDAVEYVDPLDVKSIAGGLRKILGDPAHRETLIEKGRRQALHFSRERFAGKIQELYNKALS